MTESGKSSSVLNWLTLLVSFVGVCVPAGFGVVLVSKLDASQTTLNEADARVAELEASFALATQADRRDQISLEGIALRESILSTFEKAIPLAKANIIVRKEGLTGLVVEGTVTNTSGVPIACSTPFLRVASEEEPRTPSSTSTPIAVAAGASFSTSWILPDDGTERPVEMGAECQTLPTRQQELMFNAERAGINLPASQFRASVSATSNTAHAVTDWAAYEAVMSPFKN